MLINFVIFPGHLHVIPVLLNYGAVLNVETRFEKRTALHIASSAGWHTLVEMLISKGMLFLNVVY